MKKILLYLFLSFLPSSLVANSDPQAEFQRMADSLDYLIGMAKMEEAEQLIPLLDSLAHIKPTDELLADLDFQKGYYEVYKSRNTESYELLIQTADKYDQLDLPAKRELAEAYACISLYMLNRYVDCVAKAELLIADPELVNLKAKAIAQLMATAVYAGAGKTQDLDKALSRGRQAIGYFQLSNNYRRLNSLYGLLAAVYNARGDYQNALTYIDSAAYCVNKMNNVNQAAFLNIRRARALYNMKRVPEALAALTKAEDYYVSTGSSAHGQLEWVYGLKAHYYAGEGEYKEAYSYVVEKGKVNEVARVEKNDGEVNDLMVKYETEKKQRELAISELQLKTNRFYLLLTLAGFLLVGVVAVFFFRDKKRLSTELKLKEQLAEKEIENQLYQERARIAADLHDNIGTNLSVVSSSVGTMLYQQEQQSPEQVKHLKSFVADTIQELRNSIWVLQDKNLSVEDFHHRVVNYIRQLKDNIPGLKIKANAQLEEKPNLSPETSIQLFRIVQESLQNAIKYAAAEQIEYNLFVSSSELTLEIKDNGNGFDRQKISEGNGLWNMEQRAKKINGDLEIITTPGKGTEVKLNIRSNT